MNGCNLKIDTIVESIDMESRLDTKICDSIKMLLERCVTDYYTKSDLNKKVNNDETLLEYIRDTEETFHLNKADLSKYTDAELNKYVSFLDSLWMEV